MTYPKLLCVNTLFSRHLSKLEIAVEEVHLSKLKSDDLSLQQRQPKQGAHQRESMHGELMLSKVILRVFPKQALWLQDVQDANQGTV